MILCLLNPSSSLECFQSSSNHLFLSENQDEMDIAQCANVLPKFHSKFQECGRLI